MSVGASGEQADGNSYGPAVSAHGRYVAYSSRASNLVAGDTNRRSDVFVRDRWTHRTSLVSVSPPPAVQGNYESDESAISADGQHIGFESYATNLAPNDTNQSMDVFVRDKE